MRQRCASRLLCRCEQTRYDGIVKDTTAICGWIGPGATPLDPDLHGGRAGWLSRAAELGLPVPAGIAVPPDLVEALRRDGLALREAVGLIEAASGQRLGDRAAPLLLSLRPASAGCGGIAPAILNIGAGADTRPALMALLGDRVAHDLD